MTERIIIKALAIVLSLPLFISCCKDYDENSSPIIEQQGITVAENEATRLSVKKLIESSYAISLTDFVSEVEKMETIKKR